MSNTISSTATVEIERAARWGRQLVSHLGRRHGGEWSPETTSGWIDLKGARATVTAAGDVLTLEVEVSRVDGLGPMEEVVGGHLVRFADALDPVVTWIRADGSDKTTTAADEAAAR